MGQAQSGPSYADASSRNEQAPAASPSPRPLPADVSAARLARAPVPSSVAPAEAPAKGNDDGIAQAGAFFHSYPAYGKLAGVVVQHPYYVPPPAAISPNDPSITPTGYPNTNAPLYPTPVPWVPYQVGSSVITNQAFYPHEMLYPHKYRAIFPPYYYEVGGCWKLFPTGVGSAECWRLRGTVVKVKYNSTISPFAGFCVPATH
jgi:hypothetical protein